MRPSLLALVGVLGEYTRKEEKIAKERKIMKK